MSHWTMHGKFRFLQELLNIRMNNLYVEGFDDYVITEIIHMLCISNDQCLQKFQNGHGWTVSNLIQNTFTFLTFWLKIENLVNHSSGDTMEEGLFVEFYSLLSFLFFSSSLFFSFKTSSSSLSIDTIWYLFQ